jgi:hypothetical protein
MDVASEDLGTVELTKVLGPLTPSTRRRYVRPVPRTTHRAFLTVLLLLGAGRGEAAPCAPECGRRLAECRSTQCQGLSPKSCRDRCRALTGCRAGGARIGVMASVVTKCRTIGDRWTAEQRLEVRRGDCEPTTIMSFQSDIAPRGLPLCETFGEFRDGLLAYILAPLQRVGLSPDGRTLLFEVSAHAVNDLLPGPHFAVPEEGIFAVRPDGSHLRRLGHPSRERQYKGPMPGYRFYPGFNIAGGGPFNFSPDGRFVVFSDRGPGPDGLEAGQLVVMDVRSGERTQVTELDAATQDPPTGADVFGFFVDDYTIQGSTLRVNPDKTTYIAQQFLVGRDGRHFDPFVKPIDIPGGGRVVENFQLAGREGNVLTVQMDALANEPREPSHAQEVWWRDGKQLLQLTTIGRTDTAGGVLSRDRERVFFAASTDRYGPNPMKNCQIFSVPRIGGDHTSAHPLRSPDSVAGWVQPQCSLSRLPHPRVPHRFGDRQSRLPLELRPVRDEPVRQPIVRDATRRLASPPAQRVRG